jgi:hypothetical protein
MRFAAPFYLGQPDAAFLTNRALRVHLCHSDEVTKVPKFHCRSNYAGSA